MKNICTFICLLFVDYLSFSGGALHNGIVFKPAGELQLTSSISKINFYLHLNTLFINITNICEKVKKGNDYEDQKKFYISAIEKKLKIVLPQLDKNITNMDQQLSKLKKFAFKDALKVNNFDVVHDFWEEIITSPIGQAEEGLVINFSNLKEFNDLETLINDVIAHISSNSMKLFFLSNSLRKINKQLETFTNPLSSAEEGNCKDGIFMNSLFDPVYAKFGQRWTKEQLLYCVYEVTSFHDSLLFSMYFLDFKESSDYQLFSLIPTPVWYDNLELGVLFDPEFNYLAVEKNGFSFLRLESISSCKKSDRNGTQHILCSARRLLEHSNDVKPCESHLFLDEISEAIEVCPKEVYSHRYSTKKEQDLWITPVPKLLEVVCTDTSYAYLVQGAFKVNLTGSCLGKLEDHIIKATPGNTTLLEITHFTMNSISLFTSEELDLLQRYRSEVKLYLHESKLPVFPLVLLINELKGKDISQKVFVIQVLLGIFISIAILMLLFYLYKLAFRLRNQYQRSGCKIECNTLI